jgi:hypothetical protein
LGFDKIQTQCGCGFFANGYFVTRTGSPALIKVRFKTNCFSCPARKDPLLEAENCIFLFNAELQMRLFLILIAGDRRVWINIQTQNSMKRSYNLV